MNAREILKKNTGHLVYPPKYFPIDFKLFENLDGRKQFNRIIRENVQDKFGVYIWCNSQNNEIYYIGMAGKIKTDGTLSNHSLRKRLLASRGRDKETKKDIQTNDFVKKFMKENKIKSLDFYIAYSKEDVPPKYVEAILLYEYFKGNKCLTKLNNSF